MSLCGRASDILNIQTSRYCQLLPIAVHVHSQGRLIVYNRDLARNEEFSEIAVINIFLQFSKKKTVICGGGVLRGKFRDKSRN